ncbi:MAG: 3-phosphoshikimate 1-carboxyvinyltransferase [Lachnospiraceae bacterium]|nr:3-phosphoshikimate 1-carboxyvinyltransferase [Lachnospiraceae bacterium]
MIGNDRYEVKPIQGKTGTNPIEVCVPGSKSITNRALLIAALAKGETRLSGVLFSDDSRNFLECVKKLGIETVVNEKDRTVLIKGCGGDIPEKEAYLYVGSAGTAARFLTAVLGLGSGIYHMDASEQMRKRPMAPLLDSLKELGCEVIYEGEEGHFPFTLKANGFSRDSIEINIDSSSQFLSALLIASVLKKDSFSVDVQGKHGMAYIDMTVRMMEQFGVKCGREQAPGGGKEGLRFTIPGEQSYTGRDYYIEPDASAAAYFYAMCPLLSVPVRVEGVCFDSLQGDVEFIHILEKMGCRVEDGNSKPECEGKGNPDKKSPESHGSKGICLLPPKNGSFNGITVDMSSCSDQTITLSAIAPFAETTTKITGIGHIRLQESDRLTAIVTELGKLGIRTEHDEDSITIHPGSPRPGEVETYEDHRMAMGFSLIGLRAGGIVIKDPACCKKTFENYFDKLDEVIRKISEAK